MASVYGTENSVLISATEEEMRSTVVSVCRYLVAIGAGVGIGAAMIGMGYLTDGLVAVCLILVCAGVGGMTMNAQPSARPR